MRLPGSSSPATSREAGEEAAGAGEAREGYGREQKAKATDSVDENIVTGAETVVSNTSKCRLARSRGDDGSEEEMVVEVRLEMEAGTTGAVVAADATLAGKEAGAGDEVCCCCCGDRSLAGRHEGRDGT